MAAFELTNGVEKWTIFKRVNQFDEQTVARIAGLEKSADGKGFCCPVCGHGKHGDGIYQQTKNSKRAHWYCFGCGEDYSNADVIAAAADIDKQNVAELARYLEGLFPEWGQSFSFTGKILPMRLSGDKVASKSRKDYSKMYRWLEWQKPLSSWLKIGERWRGLTYETLRSKAAPYRKAIYHDALWLNDKRAAIIFPYSPAQAGDAVLSEPCNREKPVQNGFFWRSLVDGRKGFSAGFEFAPYVISTLKTGTGAINFVFEGIIDGLSCLQAARDAGAATAIEWLKDVGLVATGSAAFSQSFFKWVVANYSGAKDKPRFCIVADNDENGIKASGWLWRSLNRNGYPATLKQFAACSKPKLDANNVLQEYGAARLFGVLADWQENSLKKLEVLE